MELLVNNIPVELDLHYSTTKLLWFSIKTPLWIVVKVKHKLGEPVSLLFGELKEAFEKRYRIINASKKPGRGYAAFCIIDCADEKELANFIRGQGFRVVKRPGRFNALISLKKLFRLG